MEIYPYLFKPEVRVVSRATRGAQEGQEMNEWVLMAVWAVENSSEVEHILELYRFGKDMVSEKVILYVYIRFYIENVYN